jgi:predicted transcriptional regulator of viral defense system
MEMYRNDYQIKKQIRAGLLHKLENGIYSDREYEPVLAIISMKYPYAVFGMNSAFYYHGLTDTIPTAYHLVTDKDATKIKDKRVKQTYELSAYFSLGMEEKEYNGTQIRIYSRERMLVDLVRYKNKFSFDYYKEIINSYRKLIFEMDIQTVQEYVRILPKTNIIMEALEMEVL